MRRSNRAVGLFLVLPTTASATNLGLFDGPRIDLGSIGGIDLSLPDLLGFCDGGLLSFLCDLDDMDPPSTTNSGVLVSPTPAPTWSFDPAEKWLGDYQCRKTVPALLRLQLLALASIFFESNNRLGNGVLWDLGWMRDCFACNWSGVTCNAEGKVVGLSLPSLGLEGRIHKFVGLLTELYKLDLSNNKLMGKIPTEMGYLKRLDVLLLHDNRLTGHVTTEICDLQPGVLVVDCWGGRPDVYCSCCTFCGGFPTPPPTQYPSPQPSESNVPSEHQSELPTPTVTTELLVGEEFALTQQTGQPSEQPTIGPTRKTQPPAVSSPQPTFDGDVATVWLDEVSECGAQSGFVERLQLLSLANLYFSTGNTYTAGPLFDQDWLSNCDPCSWGRISCDGSKLVALNLSSMGLTGRIHPYTGLLTDLEVLDMHDNYLTGEVPMGLHYLFNANSIFLHENWLSGEMPSELCGLGLEVLTADCDGSQPRIDCPEDCCSLCS